MKICRHDILQISIQHWKVKYMAIVDDWYYKSLEEWRDLARELQLKKPTRLMRFLDILWPLKMVKLYDIWQMMEREN